MKNSSGWGLFRCGFWLVGWVLCWLPAAIAWAAPVGLQGQWSVLSPDGRSRAVDRIAATGGRFRYEAELAIEDHGTHVIDFKNSSVIGRFEHRVYDRSGALVTQSAGGIQSEAANPFFLRHGRELNLPPGRYRLVSDLQAPFFLAQPEPYLDSLDHYRQAIKPGNAVVLVCLGVFLGLGLYYASLGLIRRQRMHAMYALFILGNLLYNGTALLVTRDLLGQGWFYLISLPILLSNIAYVLFVVDLLDIQAENARGLHHASRGLIVLLAAFLLLGLTVPHWSLELDRLGVGLFLCFGLVAGVMQALRGNVLARLYLLANVGFFLAGVSSISLLDLQGVFSIYIEHIGLLAVAIEVLLLALVLSYQFGLLEREKASALERAENNLRLACTDALTGLPNRYALDIELARLPQMGALTFVDLDGLKHYNDTFGHASGDQLLREFGMALAERLGSRATLHRLGGDEFAATSRDGAVEWVEGRLMETVGAMRDAGYEFSGASCGSVRVFECAERGQLKHVADSRMYENKRRRRVRDQSAAPTFESGPIRFDPLREAP